MYHRPGDTCDWWYVTTDYVCDYVTSAGYYCDYSQQLSTADILPKYGQTEGGRKVTPEESLRAQPDIVSAQDVVRDDITEPAVSLGLSRSRIFTLLTPTHC